MRVQEKLYLNLAVHFFTRTIRGLEVVRETSGLSVESKNMQDQQHLHQNLLKHFTRAPIQRKFIITSNMGW